MSFLGLEINCEIKKQTNKGDKVRWGCVVGWIDVQVNAGRVEEWWGQHLGQRTEDGPGDRRRWATRAIFEAEFESKTFLEQM